MTSEADEAEQRRERTLNVLYGFASAYSELGRVFARSHAMHTTDAAAVVEILTAEERGHPLTPARLAERIGLTTGATSILLNRLEEAGHIVRVRGGHTDRRLVTLHSTPAVHASADAFYAPMNGQLHDILAAYSEAELDAIEDVVSQLRSRISAYANRTEAQPDTGPNGT